MSKFNVSLEYHDLLVHVGGTKFWEVSVFRCPRTKREIMVRRWGKIANIEKGGEVMVEDAGYDGGTGTAKRLVNEKQRRGYEAHGSSMECGRWLKELPTDKINEFFRGLSLPTDSTLVFDADFGDEFDEPINKLAAMKPEPEPDRGADWGSW